MNARHRPTSHRPTSHRSVAAPTSHRAGSRTGSSGGRFGLAASLLVGLVGVPGTAAFWTSQGTFASTTITSGTLDVELDANEGNPTPWANTSLALSSMLPGESIAVAFPVQNTGNVALKFTATATASGGLASSLTAQAFLGGAASNGTSGGLRVGTCTGTGQGAVALSAAPAAVIGTAQQVAASANQQVCLVVTLVPTAPSSVQGATATASFAFSAKQVAAP